MFTGARRFDGRIQCQQIGLVGDVDHADLARDAAHGGYRALHGCAALVGIGRCVQRDLVGAARMFAGLLDGQADADGAVDFLHGGSLFAGGTGQRMCGGIELARRVPRTG
jgi:hypothetical protein